MLGQETNDARRISTTLKRTDTDTTKTVRLPKTLADLNYVYETGIGRLVVDPLEAESEFGKDLASQLKLDETGTIVLWPQPGQSPQDPQNWPSSKKLRTLIVLTMASFIPDFNSGIGIACLFPLAKEYNTTPGNINNLTSKYDFSFCLVYFLLGPGGILSVILVKRYGRLPILFWSQVLGLAFLIGCTFAPTLNVFAGKCLNAFFSTAPQIMGLYFINGKLTNQFEIEKLNFWTSGFLVSPFVSPWLFGYLVARINYRWAYGIGCIYCAIVVVLISLFTEETMYNRISPSHELPKSGSLRIRIETLIGITGIKESRYRCSWRQAILPMLQLIIRPHVLAILIYTGVMFGFSIGTNVTNGESVKAKAYFQSLIVNVFPTVVFTTSPPPLGYGLSQYAVASIYVTPVVAVILGELIGRHMNDRAVKHLTRRNHGIFEPEMRLWSLYAGLPLLVAGFVLLGAAFQKKLNIASVVFGWGMAEVGTMISTVAAYNYLNNALFFPGEISALLNEARVLGGFAVPYFQVDWASENGALQTFGCEAAIIVGLFILIVPALQVKGEELRVSHSIAFPFYKLNLKISSSNQYIYSLSYRCPNFNLHYS
ncbi:major facilitator superfamily domain-containing protein [Phakopsora pachyrhizi]|uniref:Major facilitator superfamily domain-containing protein n=1 Tax=Phakopsora pachyrhizi TaxID=170000 RepID=A0AAV0AGP0_PHAPC|nr:major facilitator superfamily domain-containing protein [Phakopsora pachyrhizi]